MNQPYRSRRMERKIRRQELRQSIRQVLHQDHILSAEETHEIRTLLVRLGTCRSSEKAITAAEISLVYQQASSEMKRWILDHIGQLFPQDQAVQLKKFELKIDDAVDREEALSIRKSPEYLSASPQVAKLMDEYIDESFPPKISGQAQFWDWIAKCGKICGILAFISIVVDGFSFFHIENITQLKQRYPDLKSSFIFLTLGILLWADVQRRFWFLWRGSSGSSTDNKKGL